MYLQYTVNFFNYPLTTSESIKLPMFALINSVSWPRYWLDSDAQCKVHKTWHHFPITSLLAAPWQIQVIFAFPRAFTAFTATSGRSRRQIGIPGHDSNTCSVTFGVFLIEF
jgi:hypothetical protein